MVVLFLFIDNVFEVVIIVLGISNYRNSLIGLIFDCLFSFFDIVFKNIVKVIRF